MPPLTAQKKHEECKKIDLMYRNMQSAQKYEPYYYYTRYPAETTKMWNLVNLFTTQSWMWTFLGKTLISNYLSIQTDGAYRLGLSLLGILYSFQLKTCTYRSSNPLTPASQPQPEQKAGPRKIEATIRNRGINALHPFFNTWLQSASTLIFPFSLYWPQSYRGQRLSQVEAGWLVMMIMIFWR